MNFKDKIDQLSGYINSILPSLVGNKCVFLDCAYYENIGDVLIWEGTEQFLKDNRIKCIYKASKDTFDWRPIPVDTPILLQGGGNFGDVWFPHQKFRLEVIERYPDNKIIILPQTMFYENEEIMKKEAAQITKHRNLTICARDKTTERLLRENFCNDIVLLPDMAFCISLPKLNKMRSVRIVGSTLFLKRRDKELSSYKYDTIVPFDADVHDWPSYEKITLAVKCYNYLFSRREKLRRFHLNWILDWYAQNILKRHYVNVGVKFLSAYDTVLTTRLHVAILSVLLGKKFVFFDNSYGKNSSFYQTWLSDLDSVRFIFNKDN